MLIGEMEKFTGHFHGNFLVAIERKKPNSGPPLFIVHICPDVKFEKSGKPEHCWEKAWPNLSHKKRDKTEVGFPFVQIHRKAIGNSFRDFISVDFPMEEKEIAPSLKHHRRACGLFADGETVL
jgi:hypothetical protein